MLWKDNSEYYKFYEENFLRKCLYMDENTLEPAIGAWMVTLGDGMVPFRVLEYN